MPGNGSFSDDDSFWDIDSLMPAGKKPVPPAGKTEKAEKEGKAWKKEKAEKDFFIGRSSPEKLSPDQAPKENFQNRSMGLNAVPRVHGTLEKGYDCAVGTICRVEIYPWPNSYSFFSNFRKNALALFRMEGESAPPVSFFSFMPQYHQLTAQQLRFYLHWRSCFRKNLFLKADFSYLLLFAYEIINLPDILPPEKGAESLLKLWINYRKIYPKLDKYLSEWLLDYCLIHQVSPEKNLFKKVIAAGRQSSSFKEFYLTAEEGSQPDLLLSSYSYRDSKYITEENAALFETHIPAAMNRVFEAMRRADDPRIAEKETERQKLSRATYDGAVCVYGEKKRLEIFYVPLRTSGTVSIVTDAVKLCENFVRAHCGIRPRLSTPSLTAPMRKIIEEYFSENLPAVRPTKSATVENYDEKYEPVSKGFSLKEAKEIEKQSLRVVDRLSSVFINSETPGDEFLWSHTPSDQTFSNPSGKTVSEMSEKNALEIPNKTAPKNPSNPAKEWQNEPSHALQIERRVYGDASDHRKAEENKEALAVLVQSGQQAYRKKAAELSLSPHSLAGRINEEALERIGDIVLEEREGNFCPLPDYEEEIRAWINN